MIKKLITLITLTLCFASSQAFETRELPDLGDSLSSVVSPQEESLLGFLWLGQFRAQVKWIFDPDSQAYLERLSANLAGHSRLKDPSLNVVLIRNRSLNAFAVPGGVVGVHSGLFQYAQSEDEFAAVLAHELAHLSQRHFARNIEQAKRNQLPTMAGLLAGLVLAATTGTDAGLAMITATQAAGLQSQLRYSRSYEQEADRIGMDTLISAGYSASGVADMFERMQRIARLSGSRTPEFLLTHPLSEQRVSDARARARNLPETATSESLSYQLIRAKMNYLEAISPLAAEQALLGSLESSQTENKDANLYALSFAQLDLGKTAEARKIINDLVKKHPTSELIDLQNIRIAIAEKKFDIAKTGLDRLLQLRPDSYPARYLLAQWHIEQQQYSDAALILNLLCFERPNDPDLWLANANIHGKLGNLMAVHSQRAEYHLLTGDINQAIAQLQYALPLSAGNFQQQSKIENRLQKFIHLRDRLKSGS